MLASMGIEILVIMCMSRHSSSTVLRYAQLAPLRSLTDTYKKLQNRARMEHEGQGSDDLFSRLKEFTKSFETSTSSLNMQAAHMQMLQGELADQQAQLQIVQATVKADFVASASGQAHKVTVMSACVPAHTRRTHCGWKFGTSKYEPLANLTGIAAASLCGTCLPEARKAAREAEFELGDDSGME
jgi:hypothetical protein